MGVCYHDVYMYVVVVFVCCLAVLAIMVTIVMPLTWRDRFCLPLLGRENSLSIRWKGSGARSRQQGESIELDHC